MPLLLRLALSSQRAITADSVNQLPTRCSEHNQWLTEEFTKELTEIDCIGHGDLNPGNILFDGDQVVGIIDFDVAGPTNRAFDLALLAHHLVPLHPADDLAAYGWDHEPDRARRLHILATAYGREMSPARLVDHAILRLLSMGAHMQQQIDVGNPAFAEHGRRDEPAGYRSAAAFILADRDRLLR